MIDPSQMLKLADGLEAAAKALREAVDMIETLRTPKRQPEHIPLSETGIQPSCREAAIIVLKTAQRSVHINDLFQEAKKLGATIKDASVLSSILSRDSAFVSTTPRGHWKLTS